MKKTPYTSLEEVQGKVNNKLACQSILKLTPVFGNQITILFKWSLKVKVEEIVRYLP